MTQGIRITIVSLTLAGVNCPARTVIGQQYDRAEPTVEDLVQGFRAVPLNSEVSDALWRPERYPKVKLEELLAGLERLALTDSSSRVRSAAAMVLGSPGVLERLGTPVPVYERMERVYRRSSDNGVKASIIGQMPRIAERRQALEFLERLATLPTDHLPYIAAAAEALYGLSGMGKKGTDALRRLDAAGAVLDPQARRTLADLASRSYRTR